MAAKRHVAELLISGCTNTAVGVYVALFGTPLAMFIGIVAAGVGLLTLLTVSEVLSPPMKSRVEPD